MKRSLLVALSLVSLVSMSPALADDAAASSDNKVVASAKAVGKGIMWGPKKVAQGLAAGAKAVGSGAKKLVGK